MERYRTKQGEWIETLLKETDGAHITAEELCRRLNENGTPAGLTTVYRRLEKLTERGIVRKYTTDTKGGACYQYCGDAVCEHFHLKCLTCGALLHADCDFLSRLSEHVGAEHGFSIDNGKTVFYGECAACRRNKKKKTAQNETEKTEI